MSPSAYLLDMNHRTDGAYGINEVILASALAALVFPIFSVQPLTIVGVTGLINLFNYTNFDIVTRYGVDYLQFQCWMLMFVHNHVQLLVSNTASASAGQPFSTGSLPSSTSPTILASLRT